MAVHHSHRPWSSQCAAGQLSRCFCHSPGLSSWATMHVTATLEVKAGLCQQVAALQGPGGITELCWHSAPFTTFLPGLPPVDSIAGCSPGPVLETGLSALHTHIYTHTHSQHIGDLLLAYSLCWPLCRGFRGPGK